MTVGWLLLTFLASGAVDRVIRVEGPVDCVVRSQFEMRFDPRVSRAYCLLGLETEA